MSRFKEKTMSNTIKSKVLEYIKANPTASYKEVAAACGTTAAYIYTVVPKRKKIVKKTPSQLVEKKEPQDKKLVAALEEIETQRMIIDMQLKQNEKLHAIIGYLEERVDDLSFQVYG
jgi:hypothetical protein